MELFKIRCPLRNWKWFRKINCSPLKYWDWSITVCCFNFLCNSNWECPMWAYMLNIQITSFTIVINKIELINIPDYKEYIFSLTSSLWLFLLLIHLMPSVKVSGNCLTTILFLTLSIHALSNLCTWPLVQFSAPPTTHPPPLSFIPTFLLPLIRIRSIIPLQMRSAGISDSKQRRGSGVINTSLR